jgi:hypothetical protein
MNITISPQMNLNIDLAERIYKEVKSRGLDKVMDKIARDILYSASFATDPVKCMISLMIERGSGRSSFSDAPRSIIISLIPNFSERLRSLEPLRAVATERFENKENRIAILNVFTQSLASTEFNEIFDHSLAKFEQKNFPDAETDLRRAMSIFRQAENLKIFTSPEGGYTQ